MSIAFARIPGMVAIACTCLITAHASRSLSMIDAPLPDETRATAVSPDYVASILDSRLRERRTIGIVAAWATPGGTHVIARGRSGNPARPDVDQDTIFEIGSITKVFTAALLADMVARGEVELQHPVSRYLPELSSPPDGPGSVTLLQLATHSSGLPRLPTSARFFAKSAFNPRNPYAHYSVDDLTAFLQGHRLKRERVGRFAYSNLGAGLLGRALSARAGVAYEELVRTRILAPLGMTRTFLEAPPDAAAWLSAGHTTNLDPTPYWDMPAFAGAGALRASAADLMKFLLANMRAERPFVDTHARRASREDARLGVGLGWMIDERADEPVLWHNGGTGGFRTFMGFRRSRDLGVIVLSNVSESVDDIGMHLLRPGSPPQRRQQAWLPLVVTVMVPLLLCISLVQARVVSLTSSTPAPRPRRFELTRQRISSRLEALVTGLYTGALMVLFWHFGDWSALGPGMRFLLIGATSVALLMFGARTARLPWIAHGTPTHRIVIWAIAGVFSATLVLFAIVRL